MNPQRPRHLAWLLYAGLIAYAACFLAFYPRTFAIVDEDAYITQAFLFRSGKLSYENSPIPAPHMTIEVNGREVSKYPPGNSLFLVPFTLFGWQGAFASGLMLAIVGTLLFAAALKRLAPEADPAWALLYLFYPTVVLFSRTVMSDLLSATMILAALLLFLQGHRRALGSGLCLGFACLVRYSNAVLVPAFGVLVLAAGEHRLRRFALLAAGVAPFALLILLYNNYAFGTPLALPAHQVGYFAAANFPEKFPYFSLNLLMLYPLMLIAPLAAGRRRLLILGLPAWTLLLLFSFYSWVPRHTGWAERLTLWSRYLLPLIPFLVLAYAVGLSRIQRWARIWRWVRHAGAAALFILSLVIQHQHSRYLGWQAHYQALLYRAVPEDALILGNNDVTELISPVWGWRRYRHYIEFNTPVPSGPHDIDDDTVYAAFLQKPGRRNPAEHAVFAALLAQYPEPVTVLEVKLPYELTVVRLRPGPDSGSR